ncbi:MAG: endolytic transglycosylase MltG [Fusobacteriaceae bacterium]|nr:endolytic transglycosylase MltG [Fusobacteriaceae bacterium]MBP9595552.1 endolytic transglycosylase MltG [Fusobacteriaceae bacterium]MBU9917324.1 endolytic transglycosylase MltG [Fusobacteriaceae bacterium]
MNKKLLISIAVTITLVLTLAISYNFNIKGKKYSFSNKMITIKSGDNFYKALEKLEIKSSLSIKLFVKFNAEKIKKLDTGSFSFNGKYSVNSIVKTLQESSSSYVSVTIPEGFTVKQIKERLVKNSVISEEDFDKTLSEVNDFYYYTPNGNFDGYFFPDTYQFYKGEDGKSVINKFLNRFLEKFPSEKYPDKKYFYSRLIMASIIEKEAGNKSEMSLVASVFQNRLDNNMRLQSCATVAYLFNYEKDYIYYKDLEIDSPYNTYRYKGLPPGPISNPGEESIKASLTPSKTNYFYFVLGNNGKHHFSKTYNEHMAVQNQEKRGVTNDGKIRVKR